MLRSMATHNGFAKSASLLAPPVPTQLMVASLATAPTVGHCFGSGSVGNNVLQAQLPI